MSVLPPPPGVFQKILDHGKGLFNPGAMPKVRLAERHLHVTAKPFPGAGRGKSPQASWHERDED